MGVPGEAGAPRPPRFIAGDSMRGIGVVCVFLVHAALAVSLPRGDFNLANFGHADRVLLSMDIAVIMFFALSGYLISRPFVRAVVQGRPVRAPQYVRRRLARILPAYYALVLGTVVVMGTDGSPLSDVVKVVTLTQAWYPTHFELSLMQGWTLSVEMAFYLALPLCVVALGAAMRPLRGRSPELRAGIVVVGLALVTAASFEMVWRRSGVQDNQLPLAHLWAFTPGIAMAAIEPLGLRRRLPRWLPHLVLGLALAATVCVFFIDRAREDTRVPFQMVAGTGFLVSALLLHWQGSKPWRVVDNRVAIWLGERSYGIYLWHSLVLAQIMPLSEDLSTWPGFFALVAIGLPLSALCGELSWQLIEKHAIAWSHRRNTQSLPVPAGGADAATAPAPVPVAAAVAPAPARVAVGSTTRP